MSAEEYKEIFGESELRKQKERIQGRFKVIKEKDSEGARIGKEISNYISLVLSAATSGFKLDLKQAKKLLDLRAISDPKNSEIEIGGFYRYFRHISSSCVFTGIEGGHSWLCSGDDFNNTFVPTSIYDASFKMMNSGKNYLIFYPYRGL